MEIRKFYKPNDYKRYRYFLCDGVNHYSVGGNEFNNDVSCHSRDTVPCDGSCRATKNSELVEPESLPAVVQVTMDIKTKVPEGTILVNHRSGGTPSMSWYEIHLAGEEVSPYQLKFGTLLKEGESLVTEKTAWTSTGCMWETHIKITNVKGAPAEEDGDAEKKSAFAREQMQYLLGLGLSPKAARKIFKAAGPGFITPCVDWVNQCVLLLKEQYTGDHLVCDVQDVIATLLKGAGGENQFGFGRQLQVLKTLGLPAPEVRTANGLNHVFAGARELLKSGYVRKLFE